MFRRILIANRGEVAARITRTAKSLGIQVVAVASTADRDSAWLADADEVVVIGPPQARASYLSEESLLEAAVSTHCAAVHPGWGFLAESARFATRCEAAGLTFIGPSAHHIATMGDKAVARRTMASLGLAPIPGSDAPMRDAADAVRRAESVGFPLLLKAVSGGGGRGMRAVHGPEDLVEAYASASAEAASSFGDGRLYMERMILGGRHVEVQVIADRYGQVLHLGERECSLQRRHQKVLEEAPSPGLSPTERARILPLVVQAVQRSGYRNVGTVEMLLDQDGTAWFMEMNTRLQVEHPVTEAITGVDLVAWQLAVAANERLPERAPSTTGHAIECRINAEDPDRGFRPCPGRVTTLTLPEGDGLRVDTHLAAGDRISPHYDSMVAKLIASGPDRTTAIARMRAALQRVSIEGVTTNIGLHRRILEWDAFVSGAYDTTSLERDLMGGA
jgi:acetyl-CoA carboxylase, biotin carboxylase subunit